MRRGDRLVCAETGHTFSCVASRPCGQITTAWPARTCSTRTRGAAALDRLVVQACQVIAPGQAEGGFFIMIGRKPDRTNEIHSSSSADHADRKVNK